MPVQTGDVIEFKAWGEGTQGGSARLSHESVLHVTCNGQYAEFKEYTSCNSPLYVGHKFGPFTVVGSKQPGASACARMTGDCVCPGLLEVDSIILKRLGEEDEEEHEDGQGRLSRGGKGGKGKGGESGGSEGKGGKSGGNTGGGSSGSSGGANG